MGCGSLEATVCPPSLRVICLPKSASPLTVPVEAARRALIDGAMPDLLVLAAYSLIALAVAYLGFVWFQGTRKGFADVV